MAPSIQVDEKVIDETLRPTPLSGVGFTRSYATLGRRQKFPEVSIMDI